MRSRGDASAAAPVVLVALGAVLSGAATLVVGPLALGAYAVLVLVLVLLGRAGLALTLLLGSVVFLAPGGAIPFSARVWEPVGSAFSPSEALLGVAILATALDLASRGYAVRGLGPLRWPAAALAFAIVFGAVAGYLDGNGLQPISLVVRTVAPVLIVPLLVANVLREREAVDRAIAVAFVALVAQVLFVVALYATGQGVGAGVGDATEVTSLAPENNVMALLLACGPVAARLVGGGSRPAIDVAGAIGVLSIVLSLRRSFYLALVLAILVVLLVGARRDSRRLALPVVVLVAAGVWVALASGLTDRVQPSQTSVAGRIAGLNPTAVAANAQDRYRVGERRNILLDLRRHPVAGLGAGGTWTQRVGVSIALPPTLRSYAHNVLLWHWMMLGLPGLLAYLWLQGALLRTGVRIARRDTDGRVRAVGLVVAATLAGLLLAEQTAAFTGVLQSMSVLVGALAGLLVTMWRTAPSPEAEPAPVAAPAARALPPAIRPTPALPTKASR